MEVHKRVRPKQEEMAHPGKGEQDQVPLEIETWSKGEAMVGNGNK